LIDQNPVIKDCTGEADIMAVKDPTPAVVHGNIHEARADTSKLTPGTTSPPSDNEAKGKAANSSTKFQSESQPGPIVHNKPTTVTLYASRDLEATGLIPGMHDLINAAFAKSHSRAEALPAQQLRLQSHQQLVQELSSPGTFTYVITYTGTNDVIGVASAKSYKSTATRQVARIEEPKSAFMRTGASEPNTEGWELSSMAVSPSLQRQGLAGLLMGLVEAEVKRWFLLARAKVGREDIGLVMLLTTVKEINWDFYTRRGYRADYETFHGPGWLGSENGFTVVHMSKRVEV
jgi:GNAT superfamily N-acetyltransferase